MTVLLDVFVAGRPAPKGSLQFVTKAHVCEDNANTVPWLRTVEAVCRRAVAVPQGRPGRWVPLAGYPYAAPVRVETRFAFNAPKGGTWPVPATIATGDLDKLNRAVFDALTASGVYADDALVVDLVSSARYCEPGRQGARIIVTAWREDSE